MVPLIVRKSQWRSAGLLLGSLIVLGVSIRSLVDCEPTLFTWLVIVVSGGSALVIFGQLLDTRPRLMISEKGICVAHWNVGIISWNDLSDVFVRTDGGADYICITLRNPEGFCERMSKLARVCNSATRQTGFSDFTVKPVDLGLDSIVIFNLVREQMDLAKTGPKPTESSPKYPPG